MTLIEVLAAVLLVLGSTLVLGALWRADRGEESTRSAVAPARFQEHSDRAA